LLLGTLGRLGTTIWERSLLKASRGAACEDAPIRNNLAVAAPHGEDSSDLEVGLITSLESQVVSDECRVSSAALQL